MHPVKVWVFTPSFCKADLLTDFFKTLGVITKSSLIFPVQHVIIDNHYPVGKTKNSDALKQLAQAHDAIYIDSGKDLGLHGGLNNACKQLPIEPQDIFIGVDPDDRPDKEFIDKITKTLIFNLDIGIIGLNFWVIDQRFQQGKLTEYIDADGTVIWKHPFIEMWNVIGTRFSTVMNMGGFNQTYAYYGGFEVAFINQLHAEKRKLAYLKDCRSDRIAMDRENRILFDPEYRQWKTDHVDRRFNGSFEEWLIANGKQDLITSKHREQ